MAYVAALVPDTAEVAAEGRGDLTFHPTEPGEHVDWTPGHDQEALFAVAVDNVGMFGFLARPEVAVVDLRGLGDPVTSRSRIEGPRGPPGQEKLAAPAWVLGRLGAPGAPVPPDVRASRPAS